MATESWQVSGDYIESCNCDYLCPCIYTNPQGPATHDNCVALLAFRIGQGRFGDVSLDGLKFAFIIQSGRVMADGDWVFACVIDEAADQAQRDALSSIVGGEAGGVPGFIHTGLVGDYRGVQFKAIEFEQDGLSGTVNIPDVLSYETGPVPAWRREFLVRIGRSREATLSWQQMLEWTRPCQAVRPSELPYRHCGQVADSGALKGRPPSPHASHPPSRRCPGRSRCERSDPSFQFLQHRLEARPFFGWRE